MNIDSLYHCTLPECKRSIRVGKCVGLLFVQWAPAFIHNTYSVIDKEDLLFYYLDSDSGSDSYLGRITLLIRFDNHLLEYVIKYFLTIMLKYNLAETILLLSESQY